MKENAAKILMNVMWWENVTPKEAADALGITEADFYAKTSGVSDFTRTERDKLSKLLGLDETERNYIFREEEI